MVIIHNFFFIASSSSSNIPMIAGIPGGTIGFLFIVGTYKMFLLFIQMHKRIFLMYFFPIIPGKCSHKTFISFLEYFFEHGKMNKWDRKNRKMKHRNRCSQKCQKNTRNYKNFQYSWCRKERNFFKGLPWNIFFRHFWNMLKNNRIISSDNYQNQEGSLKWSRVWSFSTSLLMIKIKPLILLSNQKF